jgi:hypothetical protein
MWKIRIFVSVGNHPAIQIAQFKAKNLAELPADIAVIDRFAKFSPSFITLENGQQEGAVSRFIYTSNPSPDNQKLWICSDRECKMVTLRHKR